MSYNRASRAASAACDGRLRYVVSVKRLISAYFEDVATTITEYLAYEYMQSCRAYWGNLSEDRVQGLTAQSRDCRDVIFLDMALASSARSVVEGEIGALKGLAAGPKGTQELLRATSLNLESAALSFAGDVELALCLQDFKVLFSYMTLSFAAEKG